MGNTASGPNQCHQCCGVMDFAEQDANEGGRGAGARRNSSKKMKSTAIVVATDSNSIAYGATGRHGKRYSLDNDAGGGEGEMIYIEAREAGEVCTSERGARRAAKHYRRKPTSIMLEGHPGADGNNGSGGVDLTEASGSFSSISEAGASILSGGRRLGSSGAGERIAPPQSTDEMSVDSFLQDDATDYAICRAMLRKRLEEDEARDDDQDESRDDA